MSCKPSWEIPRKILVKAQDETHPNYGQTPEERDFNHHVRYGILIIDKQAGPTSHEITAWVKRLMNLDRAGHGGTLDPKVTGVLPICFEESTKIVQALHYGGKQYITVMRTHTKIEKNELLNVLELFKGKIFQRPPVRASVKRRLRTRYIYKIEYLEGEGRNWLLNIACQSGTYIRKICHDIGEALGTGAHMQELRRTRSGPFTERNIHTMWDLSDALDVKESNGDITPLKKLILPMERGLDLIPKVWIRDSAVDAICNGAQLAVPGILRLESGIQQNGLVAIMTQKNEGVALMKAEITGQEIFNLEHGIASSPERVLMRRGTYPRMW
jgi:H/ACA ribonucleoprotein complex subunit 4